MKPFVCICITLAVVFLSANGFCATVRIDSPAGGYTTERIQEIKGTVTGYGEKLVTVVINGIPLPVELTDSHFALNSVASPGVNVIEVIAGQARDRVSFFAGVPSRDIKVVLTWDTPTDVDLWVIDPRGEKVYYAARSGSSGGNLDVDITSGYGPETYTMAQAMPGTYAVQVQYYSSASSPVTRANVYVILYEGTPREERKNFQFVLTKEHQVYHLANFSIEPE